MLVHRSRAKRRLLACGVRWGKSTCAAMEAVVALLEPSAGTIGWVVAPSYELANQIFRRVVAAIQTHFKHRVVALDGREQRLVIVNLGGGRSELRAKSADNPVSLLGEGLDFVIVDEAARLKREIWEEHLAQRLIDKDGWALLVSTPAGPGWFFDSFRRGRRGLDSQCASWSSPCWTNPHLDRAVIEAERARLSEEAFLQEFGGQFIGVDSEPCEVCGAPSYDAMGILVMTGDEAYPRCRACGGALNEEGKTLVRRLPNGDPLLIVIRGYEVPDDQRVLPEEGADGDLEVEDEDPPVPAA